MYKVPIAYYNEWLKPEEADSLFSYLLKSLPWKQEYIVMYGKKIRLPRLTVWVGDPEAYYTYSRIKNYPIQWNIELQAIKVKLTKCFGVEFNSVLVNLYRTGSDYVGWHRDNEPELGNNPIIASISLGTERKFCFRNCNSQEKFQLILHNGSLLLMYGNSQKDWEHCLPKSPNCISPRINLTFRHIQI
ncbi:MAG: alpha-ketoglutarate-dependent dioxygenase AlkB [Gammaproteobacteria bacterium]